LIPAFSNGLTGAARSMPTSRALDRVAAALGIAEGSALLSLKRIVRDVDGNGVEFLSGLYRPDMFRLEMPLARVGSGGARHWEPAIGQIQPDSAEQVR
ncbi:MAG: UTRA domain-containing protein, partial [Paracoccaceae bacterium]